MPIKSTESVRMLFEVYDHLESELQKRLGSGQSAPDLSYKELFDAAIALTQVEQSVRSLIIEDPYVDGPLPSLGEK